MLLACPAGAQQSKPAGQPTSLTAPWQSLGPTVVVSPQYGELSGRITSIALDPNDATGNTVYLGTAGGGVWKSTNAAGPLASVTFAPLTDTLPVFSPDAGTSAVPSLSIGAVAVQPAAGAVVLAGTGVSNDATGMLYGEGLLRSANGGLTWTLITAANDGANGIHFLNGLSTSAIAWSTAAPALVVAAFAVSPQQTLNGALGTASVPGLYYSTDSGQTWHMSTLYDGTAVVQMPHPAGTKQAGNSVTSLVWDAQRGMFFAAVRFHGYYSSADGATWTRLAAQPGSGLSAANCPVGQDGAGSASCPMYRGVLAVQAATGDLYALTVDANNLDQGLWQDLCNLTPSGTCANAAPAFSTRLDNGALETGSGNTVIDGGTEHLTLTAAPGASNSTFLFADTTDIYRCALAFGASSCMWRNTTNANNGCNTPAGVAPEQETMAALSQPSGTPLLFFGNEGGLWRSTDGVAQTGSSCSAIDAQHFENLNAAIASGGALAEVTGFAQHPTDTDTLLAALGANGSAATTAASKLAAWPQLSAGDGGLAAIDPNTPANWYLNIGAGVNVKQCTAGALCTAANFAGPANVGAAQTGNDAGLPHAPWLLDPGAATDLLVGTCRVWRGPVASGALWSSANAISPALDGGTVPCTTSSVLVSAIAAGGPVVTSTDAQHNGSDVVYAGTAGIVHGGGPPYGHVFVTTSAHTADSKYAWTDISLHQVTNDSANNGIFNPAGYDVTSIFIDPHDATGATVYVTVDGFGRPQLYRSADFGAHWLNLSANLRDVPARSVAVDPNDANTVYIATDAGVYVTQHVLQCATENCWSVLGSGLPNARVMQLRAGAQLPTGDGRLGMLRAATYGRGIWQTPLLAAIGITSPGLTAAPTALNFTAQQAATQSAPQTVTLTSTGSAPVTISSFTVTGDFAETDACAGQTLAVNVTCSVQVRFTPTATGDRSGLLTAYANIPGGQVTVALSGIGMAPAAIVLTPSALAFPATVVNQTSAAQTVSVANTGGVAATLSTPTLTGDFSLTANSCGNTLAAQTACALSIAFMPMASGNRSGTLSLTDSAGTQIAQLTGIGEAPATDTLAPASLSFAQQQIGTISAAQQVTLTNAGDVPLTLISASVSTIDFTVTNNCGTSLSARSSCAFNVSFVPSATGTRAATLTVADQFRSQRVSLTGMGVAPPGVSLSPATLTFAATGVGLASSAQTLTLTNNGGLPLSITRTNISSDFAIASSTCGATLDISTSCTLLVVFAPTAAGARAGTLTLSDNTPAGSHTVTLSGTGVDFSFTATGGTSATVSSGSPAIYSMLLNSSAGLTGNAALACTGAPSHSTCTVNPSTPSLGATTVITVTVQTGLSTAQLTPSPVPWWTHIQGITLALLIPLALTKGRRRSRTLSTLAVIVLLFTLSGCGTPRTIPGSGGTNAPPTPTPSGTYTLTVTATAAGLSHSVPLTLVVQ